MRINPSFLVAAVAATLCFSPTFGQEGQDLEPLEDVSYADGSKVGPPTGLVIMSLNDWDTLNQEFPGSDRFWAPADGRVAPADSLYAKIERRERGFDPHDTSIEVRVPDLRGSFVRGYAEFTRQGQEAAMPSEPGDSSMLSVQTPESDSAGTGFGSVFFYVRIN